MICCKRKTLIIESHTHHIESRQETLYKIEKRKYKPHGGTPSLLKRIFPIDVEIGICRIQRQIPHQINANPMAQES